MDMMNVTTLKRIQRDDPILTHFLMCEPPTTVSRQGSHFDTAYIDSDDIGLKSICDSIGKNSHLEDICFDTPNGLGDAVARSEIFEGLKHNTSINSLGLSRCHLASQGVAHEVLKAYEENYKHLIKFAIWRCAIRNGGIRSLASTLSRCTRLTEISLSSCHITDSMVEDLVQAVHGHAELKTIELRDNDIRKRGCEWLSTLLQDSKCNIVNLDLHNNMIDDSGAKILADALVDNNKVWSILLDENHISAGGWNAFSNILCNQSSIDKTYRSNHTLCMIASFGAVKMAGSRMYDEDGVIPNRLFELIEFNAGRDKKVVARQKILDCHLKGDFNMEPFVETNMEMKVLPHMLSWVGRCSKSDDMSCGVIFNFLRQIPTLCANASPAKCDVTKQRSIAKWATNIVSDYQDSHCGTGRRSRLSSILRTVQDLKKRGSFGKLLENAD